MAVDQRLCREYFMCPALPPLRAGRGGRNPTLHHAETVLQSLAANQRPPFPPS